MHKVSVFYFSLQMESALSFVLFTVQFKTGVKVTAGVLYIMRSPKSRGDETLRFSKTQMHRQEGGKVDLKVFRQ